MASEISIIGAQINQNRLYTELLEITRKPSFLNFNDRDISNNIDIITKRLVFKTTKYGLSEIIPNVAIHRIRGKGPTVLTPDKEIVVIIKQACSTIKNAVFGRGMEKLLCELEDSPEVKTEIDIFNNLSPWNQEIVKDYIDKTSTIFNLARKDEEIDDYLKTVTILDFNGIGITAEILTRIARSCRNVQSLTMTSVNNCILEVIANEFPQLLRLDLHFSDGVITSGVILIAKLNSLKHLELIGCEIDEQAIIAISSLTNLEYLSVPVSLGKIGFNAISRLSAIKDITLFSCTMDKAAAFAIFQLKNLKIFHLVNCDISNEWLYAVQQLPNIEELSFISCEISDNVIKGISTLTTLKKLYITNQNQLNDKNIGFLKSLSSLEVLHLSICSNISSNGCNVITYLKNLRELDLSFCKKLRFKELVFIGKLPLLKQINLTGSGISRNNEAKLRKQYPDIYIIISRENGIY